MKSVTNHARYVVNFRFLSGGFLVFFAWKVLVTGILPWFGLEGLTTRTEIRLDSVQGVWVGYSALVFVSLIASFAYGRSKPRACAVVLMAIWYLLFQAVIDTPVVHLLYSGYAVMAAIFAASIWRLNGDGDE